MLCFQLSNSRWTFFPRFIIQSGLLDYQTWNLKSQGQNYLVLFGRCTLISGWSWHYPQQVEDVFPPYFFPYYYGNMVYERRSKHSRASSYYPPSSPTYFSNVWRNFSLGGYYVCVFLLSFCGVFTNWQVYIVTSRLQHKLPIVANHKRLCFLTPWLFAAFITLLKNRYVLRRHYFYYSSSIWQSVRSFVNQKPLYPISPSAKLLFVWSWSKNRL